VKRKRAGWILWLAAACGAPKPTSGPYSPPTEAERSTVQAELLTRQAAALIHGDPARAEALLRAALAHDLYFGPAHNNLGVVFLERGLRYEAANEFEWAKKLMPNHPDPRVNLAILLDQVGRSEDALACFTAALEVYPGYLPALQGLALTTLRSGRDHPQLDDWLDSIALHGESRYWRGWATAMRAQRIP
jgi:tetratricopeptide (TPR) repeat protein